MTVQNTLGLRVGALLLVAGGLTACLPEEDTPSRNNGDDDRFRTILVDASSSTDFRGVNLVTGETTANLVGDDWHIALRRFNGVQLNGGVVGSGSVTAAIAHEQAGFYDASGDPIANTFINATAEMYVADLEYPYDPAELTFSGENVALAFGIWGSGSAPNWGYYVGGTGVGAIHGNENQKWVVRSTASTSAAPKYYAVNVKDTMFWATQNPDHVASMTLQVTPGVSAGGEIRFTGTPFEITGTLPGTRGVVYFDLDSETTHTDEAQIADWDIAYSLAGSGWGTQAQLRLNGGVTGAGGVALQGPYTPSELAELDASGFYSMGFVSDAASNVFADHEWFVYGIPGIGVGHSLAPNFRVFAVDLDGDSATTDDIYLVQAVNYYHPDAGTSGYVTLRVRQLD